jgi:hypothetical protein
MRWFRCVDRPGSTLKREAVSHGIYLPSILLGRLNERPEILQRGL